MFFHPQFSPTLKLSAFPPSVLPQFGTWYFSSLNLELFAFLFSVLPQFAAQWLPTLHSLGIWSLGVVCFQLSVDLERRGVCPGHSFLGMCHPIWGCSCGCFPIPVSPQERVGSTETSAFPPRNGFAGTCMGKTHGSVLPLWGLLGPSHDPTQIPPVCAPVERSRILVSGIRLWDPSLSFPAPSFAGCVALGRASSRPLPANPVEETSLGINVLGKVRLQLEENSCSWLDWDYLPDRSIKALRRRIWAFKPLSGAVSGLCQPPSHSAEL